MPRGDRTGGRGQGAGTGRGIRNQQGGNRRRRDGVSAGPGGDCVCPNCGERVPHQLGTPCFEQKCPKCGAALVRG